MGRDKASGAGSCGGWPVLARAGEEFQGQGPIWNQQTLGGRDCSASVPQVSSVERGLGSRWDLMGRLLSKLDSWPWNRMEGQARLGILDPPAWARPQESACVVFSPSLKLGGKRGH